MKKSTFILLFVFLGIYQIGVAQKFSLKEETKLILNDNKIVTGEKLFFKLFCFDSEAKELSYISKIAYVEIIDKNYEKVSSKKVSLSLGMGDGSIFIPPTFATGQYKIIAYTKWMLNHDREKFYQQDLYIINPFKELPAKISVRDSLPNTAKAKSRIYSSFLSLNKKSLRKREMASIEINTNTDIDLENLSISIKKADELNFIKIGKSSNNSSTENLLADTNNSVLPEVRGEVISGKISSDQNKNLENQTLSASIPGEEPLFYVAKTDKEGNFTFTLPKKTTNNTTYLQVLGKEKEAYQIKVDSLELNYRFLSFNDSLAISYKTRDQIAQKSISLQIENAYYGIKKDSLQPNSKNIKPFYEGLQKTYLLADFTNFPTLKETIIEIIPEMYVKTNKEAATINLRDYNNNSSTGIYGPTLVLVDGVQVQNIQKLLNFSPRKIEKVELVNRGYIYGPSVFNGVINFITNDKDFPYDTSSTYFIEKNISRPQVNITPYQPNYASEKEKLKRIPDFRHQLLWLPKIESENIEFYTSDITGNFEITLKGYKNNGELIEEKLEFTVN